MNSHKLKRVLQKGDIHLAYISRLYLVVLLILFYVSANKVLLAVSMLFLLVSLLYFAILDLCTTYIKYSYRGRVLKYILLLLFSSAFLFEIYTKNVYFVKNIFTILVCIWLVLLVLYVTKLLLDREIKFKRLSVATVLLVGCLYFVITNSNEYTNIWYMLGLLVLYYLFLRCKFDLLIFISINIFVANFIFHILYVVSFLLSGIIIIYVLFRKKRYFKKIYTTKRFYLYVFLLYIPFALLFMIFHSYFYVNGIFHIFNFETITSSTSLLPLNSP